MASTYLRNYFILFFCNISEISSVGTADLILKKKCPVALIFLQRKAILIPTKGKSKSIKFSGDHYL